MEEGGKGGLRRTFGDSQLEPQPLVIEKMKLPLAHGIQARAMAHALPRRGAQSSVMQLQKCHSPSQERRSSSV